MSVGQRAERSQVPEAAQDFAALNIPNDHALVVAARHKLGTILVGLAVDDIGRVALVALKLQKLAWSPELDGAIGAAGKRILAVG